MNVKTQNEITKAGDEATRLLADGLPDEAEKIYRQLVNIIRQHEGPEATYKELYNLSSSLVIQQKYGEAEPILKDLLIHLAQRPIDDRATHLLEQETGAFRLLLRTFEGFGRTEEADRLRDSASYVSREEQLQARKQAYGLVVL